MAEGKDEGHAGHVGEPIPGRCGSTGDKGLVDFIQESEQPASCGDGPFCSEESFQGRSPVCGPECGPETEQGKYGEFSGMDEFIHVWEPESGH